MHDDSWLAHILIAVSGINMSGSDKMRYDLLIIHSLILGPTNDSGVGA